MTLHERTADSGTFHVAIVHNFEDSTTTVEVTDVHGSWTLHPANGKQAIDMFYHPYAYSGEFLSNRRIPIAEEVTA